MKLFSKLIPLIIIPIIIFGITYHVTFSIIISDTILDSTIMEAEGIMQVITTELENPIYFLDIDEITRIINNLEKTGFVTSTIILDTEGVVITDGTNENKNIGKIPEDEFSLKAISSQSIIHEVKDNSLYLGGPVTITERIGTIIMQFSLSDYQTIIQESRDIIVTIALAITLITAMLTFVFSKNISEQIKKIQKISNQISEGNADFKAEKLDIDEIKNLADDLKTMSEKLENSKREVIKSERLSSIGELSARLAHDLRNPLSVIKNSVYVLEHHMGEKQDEKVRKYYSVLKEEVERMSHQINEVLGFVKTRPVEIAPLKLKDVIKESIPEIVPKNISFKTPEDDITINGDKEQILIVFRNLIQNAIQAIGEKNGIISITIDEDEKETTIRISDNGPGIENKIIERIFEPLYTTKQEGTGLGLVTCKTVIEQHGGTIIAENNEKSGVTFTIKIPKFQE